MKGIQLESFYWNSCRFGVIENSTTLFVCYYVIIKVSITINIYFKMYPSYPSLSYLLAESRQVRFLWIIVKWVKERERKRKTDPPFLPHINNESCFHYSEKIKVTLHKTIKSSFSSLICTRWTWSIYIQQQHKGCVHFLYQSMTP
jgi:hypothetical protein